MQRFLHIQAQQFLDLNLSLTRQEPQQLEELYQEVSNDLTAVFAVLMPPSIFQMEKKYPFVQRYIDHWVINDYLRMYLNNVGRTGQDAEETEATTATPAAPPKRRTLRFKGTVSRVICNEK